MHVTDSAKRLRENKSFKTSQRVNELINVVVEKEVHVI